MHRTSFNYSFVNKTFFSVSYAFYIFLIPFEVKKGKINILFAQVFWLLSRIFKFNFNIPKFFLLNYYETVFGKFYVSPDLLSTIAVSPVFERLDVNYLLKLLKKSLNKNKKVLFIDIGAYFGLYSVIVGNRFKHYSRIDIVAFEPGTEYLSAPTVKLLKRNIQINKLKNVKIKTIGVGSKKTKNKIGIKTDTLDSVLGQGYSKKYDEVFIKMDIDDFVVDGIKGIIKFVNNSDTTYLFVEDFVKRKPTVKLLEEYGFSFICKLTEYNSFWIKENV